METLIELEKNREKLVKLYAELSNNNKYIKKIYNAIRAMIDQSRDNIAPNWKEDLKRYDQHHLNLMTQINETLEKDKLLRTKL